MTTVRMTYAQALSSGLVSAMAEDPHIFVTGIAADYTSGLFGSTTEALDRFGPERVFDAPAMENALTGIAIGAAAAGKRPVIVHPRCDFMFLAMDEIINLASKWRYMFGGNAGNVPIVVRGIIGKGWGQGATHSQSLHTLFAHFPGLVVAMPATPRSAQQLTYSALRGSSPAIILEHRALYELDGEVPETAQEIPFGKADVLREGTDVTIVATSLMVQESLQAAEELEKRGISVEVIDPRTIRPLDEETILASVRKTGHLVAADVTWEMCGFASEVCALVAEKAFDALKGPVQRICNANCPAPVSQPLEDAFYPKADTIASAVHAMLNGDAGDFDHLNRPDEFKGPY